MSEQQELATQEYVDYQLSLNEDTHVKMWDHIKELERELNELKNELYRAWEAISNLKVEVGGLRNRRYLE